MPRKPTGKPPGRPKTTHGPKVYSVFAASKATGIAPKFIKQMRDLALTNAFRHGRIYCGDLLTDYRKVYG